jgi:predicted phage terminase large subunit-like protein
MLRLDQLPALKWSKYIPHEPTPKQIAFLLLDDYLEAGYGGAAGGGKTDGLLDAALQYFDVPTYRALLLRRTFADLSLPGALMPRAQEWLGETDARYIGSRKMWRAPHGGTLTFGYLAKESDVYQYQGSEFHFIGIDESTQMTEFMYSYMFSRLRRAKNSTIPLRMRVASNPGGIGHEWMKRLYIDEGVAKGRPFIRAKLEDNPYLDQEEYIKALMHLDPLTRRQLLEGDWSARHEDGMFRREWFEIVDKAPEGIRVIRFWDFAATAPDPKKDSDFTAGCLLGVLDGVYYIIDVRHGRYNPRGVENLVSATAAVDGQSVTVGIESEPGSSGKIVLDHFRRRVLDGYNVRELAVNTAKPVRAAPIASAAEAGNVKIVRGDWVSDFLDEAEGFPYGAHDDQIDALSGAYTLLSKQRAWRPL